MNSHKPQLLVIVAALITLLITTGCVNVQPVAAESPAGAQANAAPAADPVDAPEVNAVTEASPVGFENVVVSTEWLAENLDNPAVRVIEVSVIPGVYERGHIPGAVNFVWHTDFVDTISRDIVSATRLQELARDAGINDDSTVVLYGDNNNWFAAWGAWVFKLYGAPDVRILDGGRAKWEAEGRELAVAAPTVEPGDFTASSANANLRAHLADVRQIVEGDVRSPDEYAGRLLAPAHLPQEQAQRAGHIPTALNVPWSKAANDDGTFKSDDELKQIYTEAGVDWGKDTIAYCRIGERSSHTWFVLSQILGYDAKLYDGSWTEWGNTVGVPIENPAGTIWGAQ